MQICSVLSEPAISIADITSQPSEPGLGLAQSIDLPLPQPAALRARAMRRLQPRQLPCRQLARPFWQLDLGVLAVEGHEARAEAVEEGAAGFGAAPGNHRVRRRLVDWPSTDIVFSRASQTGTDEWTV